MEVLSESWTVSHGCKNWKALVGKGERVVTVSRLFGLDMVNDMTEQYRKNHPLFF